MKIKPGFDTAWRGLQRLPVATLAVALVWGLAGVVAVHGQRSAQDQALRQSALYTRVLADHAQRSFSAAEVVLGGATSRLSVLLYDAASSNRPISDLVQNTLADVAAGQSFVRSVSLVRGDGFVQSSSQLSNAGARIAPSFFKGERSAALPLLLLGRDLADAAPLGPGQDTHHVMLLARPLPRDDDQAPLWVVVALDPEFFSSQYESLLSDPAWVAALATTEGTLLATTGRISLNADRKLGALPPFQRQATQAARGEVVGPGLAGTPALWTYRTLDQRPLVVIAEVPEQHVLAHWRRETAQLLGAAGVLSALIAGLSWAARRAGAARDHARAERERAQQQLREQFEMTEQLVDAMPMPVFLTDLKANLLLANRAWVDWMGVGLQHDPGVDQRAEDKAQRRVEAMLGRGIGEAATLGVASWPLDLPLPGGGVRETVLTKVALRHSGHAQVTGIIGTLIDITEYKQAERATESARQAAEAASQARTEFVANVTHELRTPLQSIIGFAELGVDRSHDQARLQLMFTRIHQSGRRMLRLVEDLLDVSRIGSTVGSVRPLPGVPLDQLREVLDELRSLATGRGVALHLHSPATELPLALLDPVRYQQVARNVLANAIRFAPSGSRIEVSLAAREDQVVVTVRDHGPGIPEAEIEAIFQPFVQSSRTKDGSGGTGLGLTICRQIMLAHSGFINARNHDGGGAVFEFGVPLASAQQPHAA